MAMAVRLHALRPTFAAYQIGRGVKTRAASGNVATGLDAPAIAFSAALHEKKGRSWHSTKNRLSR
jgi:hypothetical protein